jgi:hypothetical protein
MPEMLGEIEELPRFEAPGIQENANGWGPCDMPDQFKDMPYQPFSKGDRLGKVSSRCHRLKYTFEMAKLYSLLSLVFIVHIVAYGRFTVVGF